jgi:hypothetical protein
MMFALSGNPESHYNKRQVEAQRKQHRDETVVARQ